MTRMWVCLAKERERDMARRALEDYAPGARVVFVDSAGELRTWARDAAPGIRVAIGPTDEGPSLLNVVAAVAHDGKASQIVAVFPHPTQEFKQRAQMLGVEAVLDSSTYEDEISDGLDELELQSDEVPTLVMDVMSPELRQSLDRLPLLDWKSEHRHDVAVEPATAPEADVSKLPVHLDKGEEARDGGNGSSGPLTHTDSAHDAPVIVFVSGRGGVGKTSVVAAMAVAAASWGMRVGLLDLDLSCGNLYSCFGLPGPADLGSVMLEKPPTPEELLACGRPAAERIALWGSCERPEMADVVYPQIQSIIDTVATRNDLVLVDTGTTFTDAVAQAAQQCDRLVLVVDGRPGSSVAQARLGGLAVRLGVARTRIARLANRCGKRGRGEPLINRAEVGLETARPLRVLDGGPEVSDCLGEGKVQDLADLGSKFAESSAESLAKMLSELGCLPEAPQARRLLEHRPQRSMWSFGRGREAV